MFIEENYALKHSALVRVVLSLSEKFFYKHAIPPASFLFLQPCNRKIGIFRFVLTIEKQRVVGAAAHREIVFP